MINGAPTDPSAGDYKKGAHQVLRQERREDRQGVRHPRLEPRQGPARDGAGDHRVGKDGFVGVYSANDGMAGGAIAAMKGAGIDPADHARSPAATPRWPRSSGSSPASSTRRSTWRSSSRPRRRPSSRSPPRRARPPPAGLINAKVDNGAGAGRRRCCWTPIAVTKDNIEDTVVKDGFLRADGDLHGQVRPGVLVSRSRVSSR